MGTLEPSGRRVRRVPYPAKTLAAFVKTKAFAFLEIYVHLARQTKAPLTVTRDFPNRTCTSCRDCQPQGD